MLSLEQVEEVNRLSMEIWRRATTPPPPYWLESDEGLNYCLECAERIAGYKLFEHWGAPADAKDIIHGGYSMEADGSVICEGEGCDKLLQYSLTNYGAEQELSYYSDEGWDWDDPEECYQVGKLLDAYWGLKDRSELLKLYEIVTTGRNQPAVVTA